MRNDLASHLIYYFCENFPPEFMVLNTSSGLFQYSMMFTSQVMVPFRVKLTINQGMLEGMAKT